VSLIKISMPINLNLDSLTQFLLFTYILINILAFCIMFIDKVKAKSGDIDRISEGKLFFMAALFGALGVYAGMFILQHKTRKWYFLFGIPLLVIENLSLVYILKFFIAN